MCALIYAFVPGHPVGEIPQTATQLDLRHIDGFACSWDIARNTAQWVFPNEPIYFSTNSQRMVNDAMNFVNAHLSLFNIGDEELVWSEPVHRMGKFWLNLHQSHNGIPVIDGSVYFRISENGRLWAFGSKAINQFCPANTEPSISDEYAISSALEQNEFARKATDMSPSLVWFPMNGIGRLAYQLILDGDFPDRFECWVDAHTGELLGWTNLINYYDFYGDVGLLYLPDFFDDPFDSSAFRHGRVSLNWTQASTTDSLGHYYINALVSSPYQPFRSWLSGLWVEVVRMDGPTAVLSQYVYPPGTYSWCWNEALAIPDELNLYYHTDWIHKWYKTLDPGMTGLDYPVPARARIPDMPNNAYWDGWGTNYGAGDATIRNFALFSNVIFHEYTHAVIHWRGGEAVPSWIHEGLAQIEVPDSNITPRDVRYVAARVRTRQAASLAELARPFDHSPSEDRLSLIYLQSKLLVDFLLQRDGWETMRRLLSETRDLHDFDAAFSRTYSTTTADMEIQWRRWLIERDEKGQPPGR